MRRKYRFTNTIANIEELKDALIDLLIDKSEEIIDLDAIIDRIEN